LVISVIMATTIAISEKVRDDIKEFGSKGESYEEILRRLLTSAKERQLRDLLMDERETTTAKAALERAKKKWQK
jgi:predicted CopG family antitoxin